MERLSACLLGLAFEKKYYLKYPLDYNRLLNILQDKNKKKVNFFVDLNSICKGFYKAETVLYEVGEYAENGEVSGKLLRELKEWLNNLYRIFKGYDPFFILFYDDGQCLQNRALMSTYKSGRSMHNLIVDDDHKTTDLFRKIKKWYYLKIKEQFEKPDLSYVLYSNEYETDLVPYYCWKYDVFDAAENEVLNLVLSVDKDLLQVVEANNFLQLVSGFKANNEKGRYELDLRIFDRKNAISYIYDKFQPGILTAKYIPMILAICGDKSDEIFGLSGYGPGKSVKLIEKNNISWNIDDLKKDLNSMPEIIQKNINTIIRNYKLISFEEQIKRLPKDFLK